MGQPGGPTCLRLAGCGGEGGDEPVLPGTACHSPRGAHLLGGDGQRPVRACCSDGVQSGGPRPHGACTVLTLSRSTCSAMLPSIPSSGCDSDPTAVEAASGTSGKASALPHPPVSEGGQRVSPKRCHRRSCLRLDILVASECVARGLHPCSLHLPPQSRLCLGPAGVMGQQTGSRSTRPIPVVGLTRTGGPFVSHALDHTPPSPPHRYPLLVAREYLPGLFSEQGSHLSTGRPTTVPTAGYLEKLPPREKPISCFSSVICAVMPDTCLIHLIRG